MDDEEEQSSPLAPLSDGNFAERWQLLTKQQKRILTMRHGQGMTIQQVADAIFVSGQTVKNHIWQANQTLGAGRPYGGWGTTLVPFLFGKMVARAEQRRRDQRR
jgi:DNA-binding CsgD family transcriptional regulator